MQEDSKITIGFRYANTFGDTFDSNSTVQVFYDLGDTELSVIGEQLNAFLRQCGYIRHNDLIFMEALSEDEYDAVAAFIEDYRKGTAKDAD